jgi:hypothetical protein
MAILAGIFGLLSVMLTSLVITCVIYSFTSGWEWLLVAVPFLIMTFIAVNIFAIAYTSSKNN